MGFGEENGTEAEERDEKSKVLKVFFLGLKRY